MNFTERLSARLTILESTGCVTRPLMERQLNEQFDQPPAIAAMDGDATALQTLELTEQRRRYLNSGNVDLNDLFDFEVAISEDTKSPVASAMADVITLMQLASGSGFKNRDDLKNNLTEGLLLNINALSSQTLRIPVGDYVVWSIAAKDTMLVPSSEATLTVDEVLKDEVTRYDIHTDKLLNAWDRVGRVFVEKSDKIDPEKRVSRIKGRTGLPSLRRAREANGMTLAQVADKTGLGVSTIAKHELGYAEPLYGSMEKIMAALGIDPKTFHKKGPVTPYATDMQQDDSSKSKSKSEHDDE